MISLQVLNKVLHTKNMELLQKHCLTSEYFPGYENEFNFIKDHYERYKNVPDEITFLATFKEFPLTEVTESDKYLIDSLYEEYLYYQTVPIIQKTADLLKTDSTEAVRFILSKIQELKIQNQATGSDIIMEADQRLETYKQKMSGAQPWFIPTGFEELDGVINGWARGEELAVIFARTGQGKSWILAKTLMHAWSIGYKVGYISPEMSPVKIGYRFDTLFKNFSNRNLVWGKEESGYDTYIQDLKNHTNPFIVATPMDFQKKVTVSKLKQFILANKLDILGIDGITYLSDERGKPGDNKTITLTNISEDLSSLSLELRIPILVVVQSNRGGVKEESSGTPDLEHIRDSDGIAQNATKVISLRQTGAGLELGIKKHRDGIAFGKLIYYWDIDKGLFDYIPSEEDAVAPERKDRKVKEIRNSFQDGTEVF